jgi:hypothetical protein
MLCLLLKLNLSDSCIACSNQNITRYAVCKDLPTLNATLYYTYNRPKSSLYVVLIAAPPKLDGWFSWGINPIGMGMLGVEVIVVFKKENVMFIFFFFFETANIIKHHPRKTQGVHESKIQMVPHIDGTP